MGRFSIRSLLGTRWDGLAGGFYYDVNKDYQYDFAHVEGEKHTLRMKGNVVELPPISETCHSAFLQVTVKGGFASAFTLPFIEMCCGEQVEVQYLERRARGVRYLNISNLLSQNTRRLELRGTHIDFASDEVELILCTREVPVEPTVLVISPHPDDAEIAACGYCSELDNVYVVTITAGESGPYNYNKVYGNRAEHFLKKGELRTWDSITVPMLYGVPPERSLNLGFFDGMFRTMFEQRDAEARGADTGISDIRTFRKLNISSLADELAGGATWNALVDNLATLLKRIKPDVIITPHPVLDISHDHYFSTRALFEAVKAVNLHAGEFLFYTNHAPFNELYPYGPSGAVMSLPAHFQRTPYFTAVYSHPLSKKQQADKTMVLDAMSDIRMNTNRNLDKSAMKLTFRALVKEAFGFENEDYYRRGIRSNELFYCAAVADLYDDETFRWLTDLGE